MADSFSTELFLKSLLLLTLAFFCAGASAATYYVDPAGSNANEGLFGNRPGEEKKTAALSFLEATLSISQALGNRQITDETKFREGLGRIIDGAVECLNASAWAQRESASPSK
jgi:hypothetical protein